MHTYMYTYLRVCACAFVYIEIYLASEAMPIGILQSVSRDVVV